MCRYEATSAPRVAVVQEFGEQIAQLPVPAFTEAVAETGGGRHRTGANALVSASDQSMLIARAITRAARARDTIDSKITISLAQTRTADTSVGLNARAVLNDRAR